MTDEPMAAARAKWLSDHMRTENDVGADEFGEFICAEATWIDHSTKCEVKVYLPKELSTWPIL